MRNENISAHNSIMSLRIPSCRGLTLCFTHKADFQLTTERYMLVFNILKNQSEANIIEQTEWLDEYNNIDNLYSEYKQKYETIKNRLIQEIGEPLNEHYQTRNQFKQSEFIEYSVFLWQDNYYVLGYGQHDQEMPIFLISQKLT